MDNFVASNDFNLPFEPPSLRRHTRLPQATMVKLQELPDNFTEDDIHALPGASAEDESLDDLYDKAAARGGLTDKSFEEALSDLSKTPLFMKSLDDAGGMRP